MEGEEAMEPKGEQKPGNRRFQRLEVTRRNLLKVAGVSAIAFGGGALSTGCAPPTDELIDALCDTFIPGDASVPGIGPGAIEGGMRCLMADIMGRENLNLITQAMGLLYPDFPYLSYPARVAIMEEVRQDADMSEIFYGLREATAVAFYTNGVALPVGTYNASNLPGFIFGTGDLQVRCKNVWLDLDPSVSYIDLPVGKHARFFG